MENSRLDFRLYFKVIFKILGYWHKNRHIDNKRNRTKSPEINPCIYSKLIFDKGDKNTRWDINSSFKKLFSRASLVAQWLGVRLPMQGTWVRVPIREDPTCRGAARPVSHNCWACASGACALQQERPRQWEARAPRWGVAPACRNWRKPSHRNEDPTQPKKNKYIKKKLCSRNQIITCRRIKLDSYFIPLTKINLKRIKDLNIRYETIKLLEEILEKKSSLTLVFTTIFWIWQKHKQQKQK